MSDLQQQYSQGNNEQVPLGAVQHNLSDILPSASEVGNLWTSYLAECMSVCFLKYYVAKSKDPDIHAVLQRALDVSSQRVNTMKDIFNSIHHPIPTVKGMSISMPNSCFPSRLQLSILGLCTSLS